MGESLEIGSDPCIKRDGRIAIAVPMFMGYDWEGAPLATRAVALDLFRRFHARCPDELYLHGHTLLEAVQFGWYYTETDRPALVEALVDMDRRGLLQARGPYSWAIRLRDTFRWPPGVAPSRKELFERDLWACFYCGQRICLDSGHADHWFPRSRGGWDDAANLVATCRRCNCSKGALTFEEWQDREYAKHKAAERGKGRP